jgi:hypothetical protein
VTTYDELRRIPLFEGRSLNDTVAVLGHRLDGIEVRLPVDGPDEGEAVASRDLRMEAGT